MRPVIGNELEELVREAAEKGGYQSASEFVRDASRRRAEEVVGDG